MDNKSLSDNWRENRSPDKAQDLASVLDACRVMAQSLIPDIGVTFSGIKTAGTDRKTIQISAKYTDGPSPLPGNQVDEILGLTVHEIGHCLFSDDKKQFLSTVFTKCFVHAHDASIVRELVDIYEDIYVDHIMSGYPGYKEYLLRQISASIGKMPIDILLAPLTKKCSRQDMLNAIGLLGIFGVKLPDDVTPDNLSTLQNLLTYASLMSVKKIPKEQAIYESWQIIKRLPETVDHEEDGLFQSPKGEKSDDQISGDKESGGSNSEPSEPATDQLVDQGPDSSDTGNKKTDGVMDNNCTPDDQISNDKPEDDQPQSETPTPDLQEPDTDNPDGDDDGDEGDKDVDGDNDDGGDSVDSDNDRQDGELDAEQEDVKSGDEAPPLNTQDGEENGDGTDDPGTGEAEEEGVGTEPQDGDSGEPVDTRPSISDYQNAVNSFSQLDTDIDHSKPLDPDIAAKVQQAIIDKSKDLNQLIANLAKDSDEQIVTRIPEDGTELITNARLTSSGVEEKIRRVLQDYRLKRTSDYRGLNYGRVSKPRLYRAGFGDTRVFQRRERPDEIDMVVCILFDLSGSDRWCKTLIEQIVVSLSDSLQKEKVQFIALGYSDGVDRKHGRIFNRNVRIVRLYDREIGKIKLGVDGLVWGSTPSYEGLAAAIAQLMRLSNSKKRVLIHFTDGQPNSGRSPIIPNLLSDARKHQITDIHICLGNLSSLFHFQGIYGNTAQMIQDIKQLPEIIDRELRKVLEI